MYKNLRGRVNVCPKHGNTMMTRARFHDCIGASAGGFPHLFFFQGRGIHLTEETSTPFCGFHIYRRGFIVFILTRKTMGRVNKFIVSAVNSVFYRSFVINIKLKILCCCSPTFLFVFSNFHNWASVFFRNIP